MDLADPLGPQVQICKIVALSISLRDHSTHTVLHVRDFNSHYITTNGFLRLGSFIMLSDKPSRNPDLRTMGSAD